MRAVVSQAAVLRLREVQIPEVTGHLEIERHRLHELREVIETHPPTDRAFRQRVGDDRPAARRGGHGSAALAAGLALDGFDPAELVQQGVVEPAFPDEPQRVCRRPAEGGAPRRGQRQPGSTQLGQPGCLYEARPGERPDRADSLNPLRRLAGRRFEEVTPVEHLGDAPTCRRRRPSRLGAHRNAAAVDQSQHGGQVVLRGPLHVTPRQSHRIEFLFLAAAHVSGPGPLHRVGQLVRSGHLDLRRRRHERPQPLCQIPWDDRRLALVAVGRIEKEVQGRGCRAFGARTEPGRQLAVLGLEPVLTEDGVWCVQGFAHGELLGLVEPGPESLQGVAGEMPLYGRDHVRLARR